MVMQFICLYCGNIFKQRKEEPKWGRVCSDCRTRKILPLDEYNKIVEQVAKRLIKNKNASMVELVCDIEPLKDGMLWLTRINRVIRDARKLKEKVDVLSGVYSP